MEENPSIRNPLQFKDVAYAASIRWCVAEKSALKYLTGFPSPKEALKEVKANPFPPDAFWDSL